MPTNAAAGDRGLVTWGSKPVTSAEITAWTMTWGVHDFDATSFQAALVGEEVITGVQYANGTLTYMHDRVYTVETPGGTPVSLTLQATTTTPGGVALTYQFNAILLEQEVTCEVLGQVLCTARFRMSDSTGVDSSAEPSASPN